MIYELSIRDLQRAYADRRTTPAAVCAALLTRIDELDAVCAPTNAPAWLVDHINGDYFTGGGMATLPAIAGCPHISVPMGAHLGLPLGLSFVGAAPSAPRGATQQ